MANQPDHVNSAALATMIALTALATVGAVLAVTALVRTEQEELAAVRDEPMSRDIRSLRAEQEGELVAPPAWVDREKGLVSVPIDKAIALTLADIRHGHTVVGSRKAEEESSEPEGGEGSEASETGTEGAADGPDTSDETKETAPSESKEGEAGAPKSDGQQSGEPTTPQKAPAQGAPAPESAPKGTAPDGASSPKETGPSQEVPGH